VATTVKQGKTPGVYMEEDCLAGRFKKGAQRRRQQEE